jgi:hypothetical protein
MRQSHLALTKSRRISNSLTVVRRDFVGLTSFETVVGHLLAGARAEVHLMDLARYNCKSCEEREELINPGGRHRELRRLSESAPRG